MRREPLQVLGILLIFSVMMALAYWLFLFAANTFQLLFGSFAQIIVALVAALAMAFVGVRLTMGKGRLADAGQVEKISIWAALLLSTVSAMTTSMGLLQLFSANPTTGSILLIFMSVLLGLGIQLSMLMYALRLGEGLQRMTPVSKRGMQSDDFDLEREMDAPASRRPAYVLLGVVLLVYVAAFVWFGSSLLDFFTTTLSAVLGGSLAGGEVFKPKVLAPLILLFALMLAVIGGVLRRPATLSGIGVNFSIYLILIFFSSGFGFLAYFQSTQSPAVQAINRDNYIETNTAALVRQIQNASSLDVRDALREASEGDAFSDLSKEIDRMAQLFVQNASRFEQQLAQYRARNAQLEADRVAAQQSVASAQQALAAADLDIARAEAVVTSAQASDGRRRPRLLKDLQAEEVLRDNSAAGDDGTGVAKCGPICTGHERRISDISDDINELDDAIIAAQLGVTEAQSAKEAAQFALERANTNDAGEVIEAPRPPLADRSSFLRPRDEYQAEPSVEKLMEIESTCSAAREVMQGAGIFEDLPRCQTAAVRADLARYEELKAARDAMGSSCTRSPDQIAAENSAQVIYLEDDFAGDGTLPPIPDHLQGRLSWMTQCLTAANTGSERMTDVAERVNQLESEYTSPKYDPRRVVRSLLDGDLFAIFSVLMAVVVDSAILFVGFFVNAQRSELLSRDPFEQAPDQLSDAIENALSVAGNGKPALTAMALSYAWSNMPEYEALSPEYTRRLSLDKMNEKDARALRLVLDAAGMVLVRYVQQDGVGHYQLHQKFVLLVNRKATQGGKVVVEDLVMGAAPIREVDVRTSQRQSFTPLFDASSGTGSRPTQTPSDTSSPDETRPIGGPKLGPGEG